MNENVWPLILLGGGLLAFLIAVSFLSKNYSLNNFKSKTVGDGQHGTARWATPKEIHTTYHVVPFRPRRWRKGEELPTVQGEEELVDDRPLLVLLIIVLHAAHIREKPRDVEKLPRVEHAAALGARERFAHVAHAAKGRAAAQHDHFARRVRLVEQAVDLTEVIRWRQPSRPRLGLRAHRVMLEHLQ